MAVAETRVQQTQFPTFFIHHIDEIVRVALIGVVQELIVPVIFVWIELFVSYF